MQPTVVSELSAPSDFIAAARDAAVIWAGLFVLGIGFGVVVADHGLPWWLAPVISATLFAGSLEFVLVGMLAAGAPLLAVASTTFLVNSRHIFYGLSFPLHRVSTRPRRAYSVFALCDEAFAMLSTKDPSSLSSGRILWTQLGLHASWVTGALVGGLVGATLLVGLDGVEFILTALFVVLTMDAYRSDPDRLTLVLAVGAALVAAVVAPGSLVLVAMSGFSAAVLVRQRVARRRAGASDV